MFRFAIAAPTVVNHGTELLANITARTTYPATAVHMNTTADCANVTDA